MSSKISASDLEPELSEAVQKAVETILKKLNGYTPTASDWPWHVQKAPPPDGSGEKKFLDISGTPTALHVNTVSKTISFSFGVVIQESGG